MCACGHVTGAAREVKEPEQCFFRLGEPSFEDCPVVAHANENNPPEPAESLADTAHEEPSNPPVPGGIRLRKVDSDGREGGL